MSGFETKKLVHKKRILRNRKKILNTLEQTGGYLELEDATREGSEGNEEHCTKTRQREVPVTQ